MSRIRSSLFPASLVAAAASCAGASPSAHAVSVSPADLGIDPASFVSPAVVKGLVSLIGFGMQHRPYEPATPLGVSVGLDLSLEVTLFKIPDSFFEGLSDFGMPSSSPLPALPAAKLHLHKGFGERLDLGVSALYYLSNMLIGGDVKIAVVQGEEGPTYSARLCYSYSKLSFNGISLSSQTLSPQLLMSRKMEFADPYLGAAVAIARGSVTATLTAETLGVDTSGLPPGVDVTIPPQEFPAALAYTGYLFGGVSLKIPHSGLRMTLEGSYDVTGVSTMGMKLGFTF
jgi:hypothetical protein